MSRRFEIDPDEVRHLYEDKHMGVVALAERYGCSPTTISKRLHEYSVQVRCTRFEPRNVPEETLRQLYEVEHLPIKEIAERLGVSVSTIGNRRRALGIAVRPRIRKR